MIPSSISNSAPPGEREVFQRLRDDPGTETWTVLHSLDIADHLTQISGECDFVVIIPGKGVLCLEIKSHTMIHCSAGSWYYGKAAQPELRGPFRQAADAMHSIRNFLQKQRPDLGRIVFWSAVVIPFASGKALSGEWHPWQLIDRSKFAAHPISNLLISVIENARAFLATKKGAAWFYPESSEPYAEQCKAISDTLRPSFEFFESAHARDKRLESDLKRYTEEQTAALDRMAANPRVIFTGPAGTGKTLLAMEAARRAANAGKKTLFICFNRLLGGWLEKQMLPLEGTVVTSTLHGLMLNTTHTQPSESQVGRSEFWEEELPLQALDKALEGPAEDCLFDELVVDEAQDILRNNYLDFLDLKLRGGLSAGRWSIFGDFAKQTIFKSSTITLEEFRTARAINAPEYALCENCRNTPRIASYVSLLGGLNPAYRKILRPDDGIKPLLAYYNEASDQKQKVVSFINDVLQDNFSLRDIVLLSPAKDSCGSQLANDPEWASKIAPMAAGEPTRIRYGTIHAFKGLEAPVVILTDIEHFNTQERSDLFYVGVTRALHRLGIFVAHSARKEITELLLQT